MTVAAPILARARTEGGLAARPIGFIPVHANVGTPPLVSNLPPTTDATAPEPQSLDPASVPLEVPLPPNTAVLNVLPAEIGDDRLAFQLLGQTSVEGVNGLGLTEPVAKPDVALANLAQDVNPGTVQPSQILSIMDLFSQENSELPLWVNKLREAVGDDLQLVIIDYTGFEIPWELLTLPECESGMETYLGAAVSTTRWQDNIRDPRYNYRPRQWTSEELAGQIAAFVDVQGLESGGREIEVLTELHATVESGLKELAQRLTRSEAGFGLVYLACHGHSAPSPVDYALGSLTKTGDRLAFGVLQKAKLRLFDQSRVIVFINACHSGRMHTDNVYLHTGYIRGFPWLFLSKGAVGVIGTTGFVNDAFATKMANWFLRSLRTADEPVSKLLRRWREAVLDELPAMPTEEDYVVLINACMYVYYGNPQSRLRITWGP